MTRLNVIMTQWLRLRDPGREGGKKMRESRRMNHRNGGTDNRLDNILDNGGGETKLVCVNVYILYL
jgi:hypothetical protein